VPLADDELAALAAGLERISGAHIAGICQRPVLTELRRCTSDLAARRAAPPRQLRLAVAGGGSGVALRPSELEGAMEGSATQGKPGPKCPACGEPKSAIEVLSVGGIQGKPVSWSCERDGVEAAAVHPVHMAHLHVCDEKTPERPGRIVKLVMLGAELMVFRELVWAR
jgi:hypothetical protein